jgi:hypothetical protein
MVCDAVFVMKSDLETPVSADREGAERGGWCHVVNPRVGRIGCRGCPACIGDGDGNIAVAGFDGACGDRVAGTPSAVTLICGDHRRSSPNWLKSIVTPLTSEAAAFVRLP